MRDLRHSVLLICEKGADQLARLLPRDQYDAIAVARSGNEARRMLIFDSYDLVIINTPLPDEFGSELAIEMASDSARGVVLLVRSELFDEVGFAVETAGVLTVEKPLARALFYQALRLAAAMHERLLAVQNENRTLQNRIEEIRAVDRAKCALIEYLGMNEAQAHRYIEKQAMDMRITRRAVAEGILKTYER